MIAAISFSSTRVQIAAATKEHPPQWRLCTEVVVPKRVDPLLVVERLLSALGGEVDVILVHQPEARSLLLRRYAKDTIVRVQPPDVKCRVLWKALMPKEWAPLLVAHGRVTDLILAYTRRGHQAAVLSGNVASSEDAFFDRFKYRPDA